MRGEVVMSDKAPVIVRIATANVVADWKHNFRQQPAPDDPKLQELMGSLKLRGQLEPVMVAPMGPNDTTNDGANIQAKLYLVFGFRRFLAAKMLGWKYIDAIVADYSHDTARRVFDGHAENLGRDDLSTWEQARALSAMRGAYAKQNGQRAKQKELARITGLAVPTISRYLTLWDNASAELREEWRKGLSFTDAFKRMEREQNRETKPRGRSASAAQEEVIPADEETPWNARMAKVVAATVVAALERRDANSLRKTNAHFALGASWATRCIVSGTYTEPKIPKGR